MGTRLVVGAFTPSVLLSVARPTGRLEERGLEVEEVAVASSPAQFRSLLAGDLDVAFTSPDNVIAYRFVPPTRSATTARRQHRQRRRPRHRSRRSTARTGFGGPDRCGAGCRGRRARLGVRPGDVRAAASHSAWTAATTSSSLSARPRRRLEALLAGDCDATMLNAGNELLAEQAGAVLLARAADVCAPYVGTVLCMHGDHGWRTPGAGRRAAARPRRTIWGRRVDDVAAARRSGAGLPAELAVRYVERLERGRGLIRDAGCRPAGSTTSSACAGDTNRSGRGGRRPRRRARPGVRAARTGASSGPGTGRRRAGLSPIRLLQLTSFVSTFDRFAMPPMLVVIAHDLGVPLAPDRPRRRRLLPGLRRWPSRCGAWSRTPRPGADHAAHAARRRA